MTYNFETFLNCHLSIAIPLNFFAFKAFLDYSQCIASLWRFSTLVVPG